MVIYYYSPVDVIFGVIGISLLLTGLGVFVGSRKTVVDKLIGNAAVSRRYLLLIQRKHIVSFPEIESVDVNNKTIWFWDIPRLAEHWSNLRKQFSLKARFRFGFDAYQVTINTGSEKVEVDCSPEANDMYNLANGIRRFIGGELAREKTREEIVADWQRRKEEEKDK